jgi:signal transduction histidine kinase
MAQDFPPIVIAMSSQDRAEALLPTTKELGYSGIAVSEVEGLLHHTRAAVPSALIIEHALVAKVAQLDVIGLLRRRKPLAEVPMVILGADKAEAHVASLSAGADSYLILPTHPNVIKANLKRLLDRHERDHALRNRLEQAMTMEKALKESERVKDDLTHMLVHDLKSPIASVMGLLEHSLDLVKGSPNSQSVIELMTLARVEAQHLLNLAANILDVRRMKEGLMPYEPTLIESLSELAKLSLRDASGAPRERHFDFLISPDSEKLYADSNLLRRILANLLSNAIKHTRGGGHIDFRARRIPDAIELSIRDDGEGIPEQDQKRIFNAFEQSRHTIHDRYDTGMGLTFCKLAVEKHGGKIWVESKVGRGSTFFFTLPLSIKQDAKQRDIVYATMGG